MITGVNLPMLIKLARPPKETDLLTLAREMREHGRNAIWVTSDLLRGEKAMMSCALTITNPLGLHARAAARFVHAASGFAAQIRVGARRPRDGRKEHHGAAPARCGAGQRDHDVGRRARTSSEALDALTALVERGFDEATCD